MSGAVYSTYDIRVRAVHAVVDEGLPVTVVAQAYGTNRSTIHRWLSRYNGGGDSWLQRRPVSGRPRKLQEVDQDTLKSIVMAPASNYGFETDFWTTRRLIQVFQSELGFLVSKQTVLRRLHDKRIASQEVIDFLSQMLTHHRRRHLVVVMDNAPPHVSQKTMTYIDSQPRLHVFNLPKYSPDWNPDEKVWNHLKHQELKGHQAKTKAELRVLAKRKLTRMSRNPALLRGIFFRCCMAEVLG